MKTVEIAMKFPEKMLNDERVSSNARFIYGIISGYDECELTNKYFERITGLTKQTVITCINSLETLGYIRREVNESIPSWEIGYRKISCLEV